MTAITLMLAATLKILPLGDSITEGSNNQANYRIPLCQKLEAAGIEVETLGFRTLKNVDDKKSAIPERWWKHTGISGQRARTGAGRAGYLDSLEALLDQAGEADIIIFKIGTNDIMRGTDADTVFADWKTLMDRLLKECPAARIIACTILDMPGKTAVVDAYNAKIKAAVAKKGNFPAGRVFLADLNPVVNRARGDFLDQFHPNWQGHGNTSDVLCKAVKEVLAAKKPAVKIDKAAAAHSASQGKAYRKGFVKIAEYDLPVDGRPEAKRCGEAPKKISSVGYFFLLRRAGGKERWVWCDMQAFSQNVDELLIPSAGKFQGEVGAFRFDSNDPVLAAKAVKPSDKSRKGWVEMTSYGYQPGGKFGFGRGDKFAADGAYGCFQIFYGDDLLFAFNRFTTAGTNEIGIGNFAQHYLGNNRLSSDYTLTSETPSMNASAYEIRRLEVYVK